jgi:hypothetical protein
MKLLFLAAASPAMPLWMFTLAAIVAGVEIGSETYILVFLFCAAAVAGSVGGHAFGRRIGRGRFPPALRKAFGLGLERVGRIGASREGFQSPDDPTTSGRSDAEVPTGTFIAGSLAGWVVAFGCVCCFNPSLTLWGDSPYVIDFCFTCFAGGIVSGWILQPGLGQHAMRLLWLAAGSPALPVWVITLGMVIAGWKPDRESMAKTLFICLASVAGSVVGSTVRRRAKKRSAR